MRLRVPDLSSLRARLIAAFAVTLLVAAFVWGWGGHDLGVTLGDTDDATRLVMMRDLMAGRGWFDQKIWRFQPPEGVWMHWSRLLDGGLALLTWTFRLVMSPARAETATRIVWPILWVFPGVAAAFQATSSLAGAGERGARLRTPAILAAGALVVVGVGQLMIQFRPGRVDHHDAQIVLAMIAVAGAMMRGPSRRGAVVCGVATGLGLAIGLEALLFDAGLAAAMGLRFLFDRSEARRTEAYGVSLAAATALAFLAQTPPVRWTAPACDALGWNLLLGAVSGGLLLALAAIATGARSWTWRLAALAAAGGVSLAVYLRLDPNCVHGPFADVNPAIRPFWLDHVNEVKSVRQMWKTDRSEAVTVTVGAIMGVAAWASLGLVPARRRDPAWLILGLMLALGALAGFSAIRMRSYLEWFAVASLAVAAAEAAVRLPRLHAPAAIGLGALFAPVLLTGLILTATGSGSLPLSSPLQWTIGALAVLLVAAAALRVRRSGVRGAIGFAALALPLAAAAALMVNGERLRAHRKPGKPSPPDTCFDAASYAPLAKAPAGVVLSEVDLGPFVLAHTPSSAMSAPYHRMSVGILRARGVMIAPADGDAPGGAQAKARALHAGYVLECPVHARHADRDHIAADSLQARLDKGMYPAWLAPISEPDAGLQIYRILPPAR